MFLIEEHEKNNQFFFLENLLSKLRNNQLSIEEQRDLTSFYLKTLFKDENNQNYERNEEKYMEYMSLGWYILEVLSKEQKQ
jgi:hypothetical protein